MARNPNSRSNQLRQRRLQRQQLRIQRIVQQRGSVEDAAVAQVAIEEAADIADEKISEAGSIIEINNGSQDILLESEIADLRQRLTELENPSIP